MLGMVFAGNSEVNVRRGPGYSNVLNRYHDIITSLKFGTRVEILDVKKVEAPLNDHRCESWYLIRYRRFILPDIYGWMNANYIRVIN